MRLAELPVLVVDGQASSGDPAKGHLLELAWVATTAGGEALPPVETRLVKPPEGVEIPARVQRITGLDDELLARGEPAAEVYRDFAAAARSLARENRLPRCPTVVHFSSFEERYFRWLHYSIHQDQDLPLLFVCTHRMARRLLPQLPRRSLRAVAGYFGHPLAESRRAHGHVTATALVWRRLVERLQEEGIESLEELHEWLRAPMPRDHGRGRSYPMPRSSWSELPRRPGVYRMLGATGNVLYVGKASSLRERVSSYFRSSTRHADHILEMLSQARDVEAVVTGSALEAALLETEEIHRLEPPYNRALRPRDRRLEYADRDLRDFTATPDPRHLEGPFPRSEVWGQLEAIRTGEGGARFGCEEPAFREGLVLFRTAVGDTSLLAYGAREWLREPEEPEETEDELRLQVETARGTRGTGRPPTAVEIAERMAEVVKRASHLLRRSRWLRLLSDSVLVWSEERGSRVALVLTQGRVSDRLTLSNGEPVPLPDGGPPTTPMQLERARAIDLLTHDRLIVLTAEIRRLLSREAEVELHLSSGHRVDPSRLARLLRWV